MRRIRYGVAMSLDGYIAGTKDEYDWIPMDPDIDFGAMAAQFDTYLMGRRTYEMFTANGGGNMNVWVFSKTLRAEDHPGVTVVSDDIVEHLKRLRAEPGKDIALFGGGLLFRSLLELRQVDTVEVAVLPVLLGDGIALLPKSEKRHVLKLTKHTLFPRTGTLLLEYGIEYDKSKVKVAPKTAVAASA
jgi:dihydrofolate reductase